MNAAPGSLTAARTRPGAGGFLACAALIGVIGAMLATRVAAAPASRPDTFAEPPSHRIKLWTSRDGLPNNEISALCQTRDGYLWVGTQFGLARFDGLKFTAFDRFNTPAMVNDSVNALAEDTDGNLWIGTASGLLRYRDGRFTRFARTNGLPDSSVWKLVPARGGGVWMRAGRTVGRWRAGQFRKFGEQDGLAAASVRFIERTADGGLLAGTEMGVQRWREETERFEQLESNSDGGSSIQHAVEDASGRLWVTLANGVAMRSNGVWSAVGANEGFPARPGKHFTQDHEGGLWIYWQGDSLTRWQSGKIRRFDLGRKPAQHAISCLLEDREGSIWAGTHGDGLYSLQPLRVRTFSPAHGLAGLETWSVCPGRDGRVWVGGMSGVNWIKDDQVHSLPKLPRSMQGVRLLNEDRRGTLWMVTHGIPVFRWREGSFGDVPASVNLHTFISAMYEDRAGRLWMGWSDGLGFWQDNQFQRVTNVPALAGAGIRVFLEDRAGDLWIGAKDRGLVRMGCSNVTTFTVRDGLSNDRVWALHEDGRGDLWVGTANGLNRWRNGTFTRFTPEQGLPLHTINHILEDDLGNLWLSGLRGIARLSLRNLEEVAAGRAPHLHCMMFDEVDGMESSETNGEMQPAGCKSPDGRLWFPTQRGVVVINPREVKANEVPPPVVIESAVADGRLVAFDRGANAPEVTLEPGRARVLEVRYSANTFVAPRQVRFQYRLDPGDAGWTQDNENRRVAFYTNLKSGHYQFQVRACNSHGYWNDQGDSFRFYVAPRFTQTWPFWALCALALAGLGLAILFYRLRVQHRILSLEQERALEGQRASIAQDMHDDLGSHLTQITLLSELAGRDGAGASSPPQSLSRIADAARGMTRALEETVWTLSPRKDSLEELGAYLCQYTEEWLQTAGLRCRVQAPVAWPERSVSSQVRHHVLLAFKEALNNIVRHAQATEVRLALTVTQEELIVRLEDNGRGFDPHAPGHDEFNRRAAGGNGLPNMRSRLAGVGGRLDIESQPGDGTRVVLTLRLNCVP